MTYDDALEASPNIEEPGTQDWPKIKCIRKAIISDLAEPGPRRSLGTRR